MGSHHQNKIVEHRIKELTLGSWTLLLHATRLWPEAVSTIMCPFSFKSACQRYNSLEMDENRKTPEKKFSGVDFQIFPADYHTWVCPVFIIKAPPQGGPTGLPKWEPMVITGVYIGHFPFHAGSVALVLNTRTGHVSPQYHMVFGDTFSTVEHMRKGRVPVNWKNLIEDHSELAT